MDNLINAADKILAEAEARGCPNNKAAHTPGPWRFVSNSERGVDIRDMKRTDGSSLLIAEVFEITDRDENARLIAAAPELGDLVLRMYTHISHGAPTRAEAEIVLKKAGLL